MSQKYRAQILLEVEQHQALLRIANNQGRSISDVAREAIDIGLRTWEQDTDALWEQRMAALDRLHQIREAVRQSYGNYTGDLVSEARKERDRQNDIVWGSRDE